MFRNETYPQGLVGAGERDPIGVHISTARKGPNGAPTGKGRFYLTTQSTQRREFGAGGKTYSSLARDYHPAFGAWNEAALALGVELPRKGPGRFGTLRGNLIHTKLSDLARWSRSMHKFPSGRLSPPSLRPACEGNGIRALRFSGVEGEEERFSQIACPNQDCEFAMAGLCKPAAHLLFMLRWDQSDPFERGFPALLAEFSTGSWETLANLRGLFELVLGTAAVRTPEEVEAADAAERATWHPGLAAELGIAEPSLVGMPFVMTVTERTRQAKPGKAQGTRYNVVSFTPDGNLVEWLLHQRRQRLELSGVAQPLALPPSVQDDDFEEERHASRAEVRLEVLDDGPVVTLSAEEVEELRDECGAAGASWDAVEESFGRPVGELRGRSRDDLRRRVRGAIERLGAGIKE